MTAAAVVGILAAGGVYLVLQRGLVRVTFGFILLGHAANVLLLSAGGMARRTPPLVGEGTAAAESMAEVSDPLPQAFALTAIVITFGITVYLFGLAGAGADEEPEPGDADSRGAGSQGADSKRADSKRADSKRAAASETGEGSA